MLSRQACKLLDDFFTNHLLSYMIRPPPDPIRRLDIARAAERVRYEQAKEVFILKEGQLYGEIYRFSQWPLDFAAAADARVATAVDYIAALIYQDLNAAGSMFSQQAIEHRSEALESHSDPLVRYLAQWGQWRVFWFGRSAELVFEGISPQAPDQEI